MLTYAGIGSRETPETILATMGDLATELAARGWHLRSGGADGADRAFADGCPPALRTIYLPWPGYNGLEGDDTLVLGPREREWAERCVAQFHPAWHRCRRGAQALHARNAAIIRGTRLDRPVDAVVCWTRNGVPVGGTATGIRMAEAAGIEVINLARYTGPQALARIARIEAGGRD